MNATKGFTFYPSKEASNEPQLVVKFGWHPDVSQKV